jgi:hypothetical protein
VLYIIAVFRISALEKASGWISAYLHRRKSPSSPSALATYNAIVRIACCDVSAGHFRGVDLGCQALQKKVRSAVKWNRSTQVEAAVALPVGRSRAKGGLRYPHL